MSARRYPPHVSTTLTTASHGETWYQRADASVVTSTSPTCHRVPSSAAASAADACTGALWPGLLSMMSGAVRSSAHEHSQ